MACTQTVWLEIGKHGLVGGDEASIDAMVESVDGVDPRPISALVGSLVVQVICAVQSGSAVTTGSLAVGAQLAASPIQSARPRSAG